MTAQEVREAEALASMSSVVGRLASLQAAVEGIEKADPDLAAEAMEDQALADGAALLQDLRSRLADVELALVGALGKRHGNKYVGALSDGRQFTVNRSGDRKEWDHEDWKRDVRRVLATEWGKAWTPDADDVLVNVHTGETATIAQFLQHVLTIAQEVHGSTAPRSTSLKSLGLYAGDYCTTTPGPWRLSVVKPTAPTTTTEEK